ncbi:PREDICTED: uncharacterized protein C12orf45 homolog [Amphimedon queenslandica]|uniref:Uncharacterized protein n=1 Tax=Amphimedon queenslandica TaxID=400682 RepID=A0A1X7UVU7_AMPQE|nr:PREDICTED: uncharacterized protein C12orf45 homolog [Amphimedon queenslandica]|eukprot:XP_003386615.1 PREDICTED: uncharacterized protein C12orf45 homolog [Amphimedon queenslandica]
MAERKQRISKELLKKPVGPGVPLINGDENKHLKTFKIERSSTLSQVKSFLPSLARANQELSDAISKEGGNEKVSIETPQDSAARCIQLDLALVQYEGEEEEERKQILVLPDEISHPSRRGLQIEELK